MATRVEIVENKSKYDTDDLLSWIREIEWYEEKLVSYATSGVKSREEEGDPRLFHYKFSNYASHDVENRFKVDWESGWKTHCPRGTPTHECSCSYKELRLINPDRLSGDSPMFQLAGGLTGSQRRADVEVLVDLAGYLFRALGWGLRQHAVVSSGWNASRGYDSTSFVSSIPRRLHEAGLGVGVNGQSLWDQDLATNVRPKILQSLIPIMDYASKQWTEGACNNMEYMLSSLIESFQLVRHGHRANQTRGTVEAEELLRQKLTEMLNNLNSVH